MYTILIKFYLFKAIIFIYENKFWAGKHDITVSIYDENIKIIYQFCLHDL